MSTNLSIDGENRRRVNDNVRFITGSGLPTDGFTGLNICGPSSFYFDIVNKLVYINVGTILAPVWSLLGISNIAVGSITSAMLANLAVTSAKLAVGAVGSTQLAAGSVGPSQLAALSVATAAIQLLAVNTAQIQNLAVTAAKIGLLQVGAAQLSPNGVTPDKTAAQTFQQATGTISSADIVGTGVGQFGNVNGYPIIVTPGAHTVIELISLILIYQFSVAAYTAGGNITVNRSGGGGALTGLISAANSVGAAANKIAQFPILTTIAYNLTENEGINLVTSAAFTQPGTAAGVIRYICNYRAHATGL
jgi:hypothetical protein